MTKIRLAVAGCGLIGKRHIEAIAASKRCELAAIVDPMPEAADFAKANGAEHYTELDACLARGGIDGVILATPNGLHASGAMAAIDAGVPALVEKPLCSTLDDCRQIVSAAAEKNVPLATGHHRRHNPLIAKAKELVREGALGDIATIQATTWFYKPDFYFDVDWRRKKGAGPIYLNLIHDIDLLHHFCGAVESVHAFESNRIRGNEVEDTAVVSLRFVNGTLGTMNISDTAVAPWSWELTARENPAYPATHEDTYWLGGTEASLALPSLTMWQNRSEKSWWQPILAERQIFSFDDPLVRQVDQFAAVIADGEKPLVTGADGLAAVQVIEAIKQSAATGIVVRVAEI